MPSFTVPARFCGPPDSGNGGYTCGLVARELGGVVECTLRAPVPLEAPLELERTPAGAVLRYGEKVIIEAEPATVAITPPAPVSFEAATEAMASSPAHAVSSNGDLMHPFATCFVCGPKRRIHDGLRIFPSPAKDGVYVAAWVPELEFSGSGFGGSASGERHSAHAQSGNGQQLLRPEFLWAAMDCPTGFASGFPTVGTLVTGRLAVQQLKGIRTGAACVLMSWPLGIEGRKHFSAACLYQDDELCAVARATWIRIES